MNLLLNVTQQPTLSSRDIAALTGKQLKHIHRDIAAMLSELADGGMCSDVDNLIKRDKRGHIINYHLPYRECLTLVTGYDVKLRVAIIDRLLEHEKYLQRTRIARQKIVAIAKQALAQEAEELRTGQHYSL